MSESVSAFRAVQKQSLPCLLTFNSYLNYAFQAALNVAKLKVISYTSCETDGNESGLR